MIRLDFLSSLRQTKWTMQADLEINLWSMRQEPENN